MGQSLLMIQCCYPQCSLTQNKTTPTQYNFFILPISNYPTQYQTTSPNIKLPPPNIKLLPPNIKLPPPNTKLTPPNIKLPPPNIKLPPGVKLPPPVSRSEKKWTLTMSERNF